MNFVLSTPKDKNGITQGLTTICASYSLLDIGLLREIQTAAALGLGLECCAMTRSAPQSDFLFSQIIVNLQTETPTFSMPIDRQLKFISRRNLFVNSAEVRHKVIFQYNLRNHPLLHHIGRNGQLHLVA
jgi:hypothetical protein